MMNSDTSMNQAADHLLCNCGNLKPEERVAIVYDSETQAVATLIAERARIVTSFVDRIETPLVQYHGEEPLELVTKNMGQADLILGLRNMSMIHTQARLRASELGRRYLSLPEYSLEFLANPEILTNFRAQAPIVRWITEAFTQGNTGRFQVRSATSR